MARRVPLIAPGSVLAPREETESVMEDVLERHRERKKATSEEPDSNLLESQNSDKLERKNERILSNRNERMKEISSTETGHEDDIIERAIVFSTRPGADLTPWGTRLPRALKKRLDYQTYRLKDRKVSGQGLTILALERLLSELEAQESDETTEA
jgi:hypothetical protein